MAVVTPRLGPVFDSPVLVTGLPRSGTSLVTGLLGVCGLWLGSTVPGGKENPRGFFEHVILREKLQKEMLRRGGFDPLGVQRLPPRVWAPEVRNFRDFVGRILGADGYSGELAWGFKDAKMSLTWRIWDRHFPQARWIVVRRPAEQIVDSCLRTSFMRHHSTDASFWRRFVEAYLTRLADLQATVRWHRVIESGDVVHGRLHDLEQLVAALDLEWLPDAVRAFVEPESWHASHIPS